MLALLAEALWIERTLASEVLPELVREADSEWLADALSAHLEETRGHAQRVEAVFVAAGAEPTSAASPALEGLRKAHDLHVDSVVEPRLRDLFLCDCAARTEHLEIALYTDLAGLAETIELDVRPIVEILGEERLALDAVGQVAERLRGALPA
ncbi:MAG TPA: DUF892 family protein [Gaiellaceae bacterium]